MDDRPDEGPPTGGTRALDGTGRPAGRGAGSGAAGATRWPHPGLVVPPALPGPVLLAAVLAFVLSALGGLATLALLVLGLTAVGLSADAGPAADPGVPGLGQIAGDLGGLLVALGGAALAWTAVMVWGAVRALRGRGRAPLLVAGGAASALLLAGTVGDVVGGAGAGSVVPAVLFTVAALATVVLPCLPSSAAFFAAHRARRTGPAG